jgi:segregation and condensation protein B
VLRENREEPQKLSKAALETLAIIAYHQPATRAEIEAVRGVAVSKGTLDHLLEIGWLRPRGRRRAPGRPVVYVTTDAFLEHFSLEGLEDLPGKEDLKAAGLLDETAPDDFEVPDPTLAGVQDELPLEEDGAAASEAFHTDFLEGGEPESSAEPE